MTDENDANLTTTGESRADAPERCAHCDEQIAVKEWHPVVAGVDDSGSFYLHAFCSEACRRTWESD